MFVSRFHLVIGESLQSKIACDVGDERSKQRYATGVLDLDVRLHLVLTDVHIGTVNRYIKSIMKGSN